MGYKKIYNSSDNDAVFFKYSDFVVIDMNINIKSNVVDVKLLFHL